MDQINRIKLRLKKLIKNKTDPSATEPVQVYGEKDRFYLILKRLDKNNSYLAAKSQDGFDFDLLDNNRVDYKPQDSHEFSLEISGKKVSYSGDRQIFFSGNKTPLISSPNPTEIGGAYLFPEGIIVLYFEKLIIEGITGYKAFLAQFDKNFPDKMLWKTGESIWTSLKQWPGKKVNFLGSAMANKKIIAYWQVDGEIIFGVYLSAFAINPERITGQWHKLERNENNPIITPRADNDWENFTTLNPAAAYIDKKVHILYRAQGYDYISSVGYAVSSDGVHIDQRSESPIYGPSEPFELNKTGSVNSRLMSAGGYGGCEDPRITVIDGRVQMVYVAFDGWANLRLALTSIDLDDFINQRWNWEKPVLISPPNVIDKSGCLFPEKIRGKYVFLHRVFPNILLDYVDDLNFKNTDKWLYGQYSIKVRPDKWDSRKIGAGAPPIKTKDGWLLIYYGVSDDDASKYHIGAMLLDLDDPTKVLHRSNQPILSPKEEYENSGFKPGIAYPCGAVVIKDKLLVYYGAADSVVCVAQASLDKFLEELKSENKTHLFPVKIKEVDY